jgi:pimeloyl-ACP methyl ester carboxylesterase
MENTYSPTVLPSSVVFGRITVDCLNIAYREAGDLSYPKLVLLHGWPSSSHQYRDLIPTLAHRFHVIAPDYPGFGNSDAPDPSVFEYTFDKLSEFMERFLEKKGFDRFGLYVQDYGGPIGFRIVTKKPDSLEWLIIQNTNTYDVGFSEAWNGLRHALWLDRNETNENAVASLLELETVKAVYLTGSPVPELISPDSWNSDFPLTLQRQHGRKIQMDLFYDYRTNPERYPKWQSFLKKYQPKTIIFWGQGDIFFTPTGGEAYLTDLPNAEMHRLNAGHFATEDCLDYIADGILSFYDRAVSPKSSRPEQRPALSL